jgi:hypothetical protein
VSGRVEKEIFLGREFPGWRKRDEGGETFQETTVLPLLQQQQ